MTIPNEIIKINILVDENTIGEIHVFYGTHLEIDDLEKLFKRDPKNSAFINKTTGNPIFNDLELENILKNNIHVKFLDQQIHFDDSIGAIKMKIINGMSYLVSFDELYLFCLKREQFNPVIIYQSLTQNGRIPLTKIRLYQFILNIIYDDNKEPVKFNIPDKEIYDYDDILELNITEKFFIVSKTIGQKFFIVSNEYPIISNPYNVIEYDKFIEDNFRNTLTTSNHSLLLNTGNIIDNNIYLCMATNVYKDAIQKRFSENYITRIYFPALFINHSIKSLKELESKKQELLTEGRNMVTEQVLDNFNSVDLFYDIYKERTTELEYKSKGIKSIGIILQPIYPLKIPLDIIFKIIHSTHDNPLVKFNPSTKPRRENIYRLFADKITKDGKKIPNLSKSIIIKLIKTIGKSKSVAVYINYQEDIHTDLYPIICEFYENGNIHISCDFERILSIDEVNTLFKSAVNPIIDDVRFYLEQNGYSIQPFENILDDRVKIEKLKYDTVIKIDHKIKLDDIIGCVTSIFIVETRNFLEGIQLRFKRVSNFNNMTSSEAFIIEQAKQKNGLRGMELISALVENYKLKQDVAISLLEKVTNGIQLERGLRGNEVEIKINPGFKTIISFDKFKSFITISVDNIDNINYLHILPIYLDSFVRLTQNKTTTLVQVERINTICGIEEIIEPLVNDFIAIAEAEKENYHIPYIDGEELKYDNVGYKNESHDDNDDEPIKNAFDLIYGDDMGDYDEDNEEDDILNGGAITPSSESSVSSYGSLNITKNSTDISKNIVNQSQLTNQNDIEYDNETGYDTESNNESVNDNVETEKPSNIQSRLLTDISGKKTSTKFNLVEPQVNSIKNIDGMKLVNKNPFQQKLEDLDPIIFNNPKQTGKYNAYSRSCPHHTRRQPVIITEDEMHTLEKEKPGFLEEGRKNLDIMKYGSTPDKQFYFMCPRYWCMKTNKPMTSEEVKSGVCGKVIPKDAKTIPKGHYVYEFFEKTQHGSQDDDKYKVHKPGFYEKKKHVDGFCMPCCFSKWNTPEQIRRREECSAKKIIKDDLKKVEVTTANIVKKDEPSTIKNETTQVIKENDIKDDIDDMEFNESFEIDIKNKDKKPTKDYVLGPERFPLDKHRWGYLPLIVQKMLNEVNADCQVSKTNTSVKLNHNCLLRHGVEYSKSQSFLSCICDALYYIDTPTVPSISQFKTTIIKAITLDTFMQYQNGNLMTNFLSKDLNIIPKVVIKSKYTTSKLYSKLDKKNINDVHYFKSVINAYENFILFLKSDDSVIDYTYLWDLICKPNELLFKHGINLIILEVPYNDSTSNVELICPTNQYSSENYNPRKQTLIVIKQGDVFEPIYKYRNEGKKLIINKTFKEYDPHLPLNIKMVFKKIIKPLLNNICIPLSSMPRVYNFKRPILLTTLITIINKLQDYDIVDQVINYQGKVVYLRITNTKLNIIGIVPCFPASIDSAYDYKLMNDESIYNTYNKTKAFLLKLYKDSHKKINCMIEFKVLEDEMVVGVITETNQFIQLSTPEPISNITDPIKILNEGNYLSADNKSLTLNNDKNIDYERVDYIKKIKMETNFYNVFRNTVRNLLNKYENIKIREKIEENVKSEYILYNIKLQVLIESLHELIKDSVIFSDEYDYNLINEISTCIIFDEDKCNKQKPLCAFSTGNTCQLILPKKNLINGKNNQLYYFGRMADELIRYNRINSFIFKPQSYLSFGNLGYNLRENELLVSQSVLLQEDFLKDLVPFETNPFITYNTYDDTLPMTTQTYDNKLIFNEDVELDDEIKCIVVNEEKISSVYWRKCFPETYGEIVYGKQNICGFQMLIDIVNNVIGKQVTINDIKRDILLGYAKYFNKFEDKLVDILIKEGKKTLGNQLKTKSASFENFVYISDYFVTNFDIWIILEKYKINCFFISSFNLLETQFNQKYFALKNNDEERKSYIFIICPGKRDENVPQYKLIQPPDKNLSIPLFMVNEEYSDLLTNSINESMTVEKYLTEYVIHKTTTYIPKKVMTNSKKNKKYVFKIIDENESVNGENIVKPVIEPIIEPVIEPVVVDNILTNIVEQKEVLPIKETLCNKDCSKEPIKTKCNPKTKRCIAPKKSITKTKKVKFIIETETQ